MGKRKPFTLRERRAMCQSFGHRPRNNWGSGDLPAAWCEGDLVELVGEVPKDRGGYDRLRGMSGPLFVVTYATSIGEGDEWYYRVSDAADRRVGSDRLHVIPSEEIDFTAPFRLVETVDPEGLAEREERIAAGWSYVPPERCAACGQRLP